ncbi:MAG TPA: rhomboid family intramembrane serine protease [Candidatus Methylomirabilis sp.]|nr:rhomboid family intramembrane serine protease [Anaeromyxobacteraceae bacterium]HXJ77260.1 rhomboid family intramembrane serine protease [Candidatus Methylomirabilis sp.]
MLSVIPLSDADRRPTEFPWATLLLIFANVVVFACELVGGDAFVLRWSAIPADIAAGHHWTTLSTAMFLHASWSHTSS